MLLKLTRSWFQVR
uniref:Uncharacterized protein n=1 Tax=Arundo donax TaxID=35708 RepID=A0A0A8YJF1_ARUDO